MTELDILTTYKDQEDATSEYTVKIDPSESCKIFVSPSNRHICSGWTNKALEEKYSIEGFEKNDKIKISLPGRKSLIFDYCEMEKLSILIKLYEKETNQEFSLLTLSEFKGSKYEEKR